MINGQVLTMARDAHNERTPYDPGIYHLADGVSSPPFKEVGILLTHAQGYVGQLCVCLGCEGFSPLPDDTTQMDVNPCNSGVSLSGFSQFDGVLYDPNGLSQSVGVPYDAVVSPGSNSQDSFQHWLSKLDGISLQSRMQDHCPHGVFLLAQIHVLLRLVPFSSAKEGIARTCVQDPIGQQR